MSFVLIVGPRFRLEPALKRWIGKQTGSGFVLCLDVDVSLVFAELGPLVEERNLSEIDLSLEMDLIVDTDRPTLERRLQELLDGSPQTWPAVFTELNFASNIWRCYVQAKAIRQWCAGKPQICTLVTRGVDRNLPRTLLGISRENVLVRDADSPVRKLSFRTIVRLRLYWQWLSNFVKELFCIAAAKLQMAAGGLENPLRPPWCIFINGSMRTGRLDGERFLGELPKEAESNWVVLTSPVHQNSQRLRSPSATLASIRRASSEGFNIAQSFARSSDVVTSYLGRRPNVSWSSIADFLEGLGLCSFLLEVKRQFFFVDAPKQMALSKCLSRAHLRLSTRAMVVPIFELVEGRAAVRSGNRGNISTFGVQHGQSGPWGLWRFCVRAGCLAK